MRVYARREASVRRKFLKVAVIAVGGFLSECVSALRPDAATATPAPAPTPTALPAVEESAAKTALYIIPRGGFAVGCHTLSEAVLKGNGVTLAYASWTMDPIPAGGTVPPIQPDLLVDDVNVADYDAIIYECGTPTGSDDPPALRIAREAAEQGKVLGAICMMAAVLACAGVLKGKKATVNPTEGPIREENGAIYTKADAEHDGKIVTASYDGRAKFGPLVVVALLE
jgi:protease I